MNDIERIERIWPDTPALEREGHEFRYRMAAGYISAEDRVIDFGCGIGYGALLLRAENYVGVDIANVIDPVVVDALNERGGGNFCFLNEDVERWSPSTFDVAVAYEIIEHVSRPLDLIDRLCRANKYVLCSVPIIPTVGINPFHLHDFDFHDLPLMFHDRGWRCVQSVLQTSELSGVYVFAPR